MKRTSGKKDRKAELISNSNLRGKRAEYCIDAMALLHAGAIQDAEVEAACYYEYARESKVLTSVARFFRHRKGTCPTSQIHQEFSGEEGFGQWVFQDFSTIWKASDFPSSSWNRLSPTGRKSILNLFPKRFTKGEEEPLSMTSPAMLDAIGILSEFKRLADEEEKSLERGAAPAVERFPIVVVGNYAHVIFTLDLANETPTRAAARLKAWMAKNPIARMFSDAKVSASKLSTSCAIASRDSAHFRARLKDLAVWRLLNTLGGFHEANDFAKENRKKLRKNRGGKVIEEPLPFYGKPGDCEGDLFADESSAWRAVSSAREFLSELMPREFKAREEDTGLMQAIKELPLPRKR